MNGAGGTTSKKPVKIKSVITYYQLRSAICYVVLLLMWQKAPEVRSALKWLLDA